MPNQNQDMSDALFEDGGDLVVNLDSVEEQKYEAIPRGVYNAVIESCEYALSQSSGNPMWTMKIRITDGEYEDRRLFTHVSFSPKALPRTKKMLMQFAPELLQGPFKPQAIADDGTLIDREVRVKVKIEKYEGENRSRIDDILAPANGGGSGFFKG